MSGSNNTVVGVACGIGAGALWGLVFLAPALVHEFGPLHLTIGRYLFYGLFSALLIAPLLRRLLPRLGRREWLALVWLALAGNVVYYMLLSAAVQRGGIAMTSLVIGFLPVAVTIVGSREAGAVPLRRLLPPLLLWVAGAPGMSLTRGAPSREPLTTRCRRPSRNHRVAQRHGAGSTSITHSVLQPV